jgi:hypothetical protein
VPLKSLPKEGKCDDAVTLTGEAIAAPFVVIVHAPGKVKAPESAHTVLESRVNTEEIAVVPVPENV